MTERIASALFPFSLVFALALLVKGYDTVGDGFSGGAVAGLGAALQYVCLEHRIARRRTGGAWSPILAIGGLSFALLMLLSPVLAGYPPVMHLPRPGQEVITFGLLKLHTSVAFDLAVASAIYGTLVTTFDRLFPPSTEDS